MINELYENLILRDSISKQLDKLHESKSWEEIAVALYGIIDDIDTADDMCKENATAFRNMVMKLQAKKNKYMYSPDGYIVKRVDEWKEPSQEQLDKISQEMFGKDYDRLPVVMQITVKDKAITKSKVDVDEEDKEKQKKSRPPKKKKLTPEEWKKQFSDPIRHGGKESKLREKEFEVGEIIRLGGYTESPRAEILNVDKEKNILTVKNLSTGKIEEVPIDESKLKECVCHIYEMDDDKLLEFYAGMVQSYTRTGPAALIQLPKDKAEVEGEIRKRGLDIERGVDIPESKLKEDLSDYARKELELAGLFDKDSDYNGMLGEAALELIELFAKQGHSGLSAALVRELFDKLASYKPLTEISDDPDEWNDISEYQSGIPGWQSSRSPSCFSEDGGKTYWDIDEDYFFHEDEDGTRWSGGLSVEEWDKRPIHNSVHMEKKGK